MRGLLILVTLVACLGPDLAFAVGKVSLCSMLFERPRLKKTVEEKVAPSVKAARDYAAFVEQTIKTEGQARPPNWKIEAESLLYKRVKSYSKQSAFRSELEKYPIANQVFLDSNRSYGERFARRLETSGRTSTSVPRPKTDPALYPAFRRARHDPTLVTAIQNPDLQTAISEQTHLMSNGVALETVRFLRREGISPFALPESERPELLRLPLDVVELERQLIRDPVAWSIYLVSGRLFDLDLAERLVEEMKRLNRVLEPQDAHELYGFYFHFKNDPRLRSVFQRDKAAWIIFETTERPLAEMVAQAVISAVGQTGQPLNKGDDALLHARYVVYRSSSEFRKTVASNSQVVAILTAEPLSLIEQIYLEVRELLLRTRDRPNQKGSMASKLLYNRWLRVRADPVFAGLIELDVEIRDLYAYVMLDSAGKTGHDFAGLIRKYGDHVPDVIDNAFLLRLHLARGKQSFERQLETDGDISKMRDKLMPVLTRQWNKVRYSKYGKYDSRKKTKPDVPEAAEVKPNLPIAVAKVDRRRDQFMAKIKTTLEAHRRINGDDEGPLVLLSNGLKEQAREYDLFQVVKSDTTSWLALRRTLLRDPVIVAFEVISYYKTNGSFPIEDVDPVLYRAFREAKANPELQSTLQSRDPQLYDHFKRWMRFR